MAKFFLSPDFIGKKLGRLTVIDLLMAANGDQVAFCRCDCGQTVLVCAVDIKTAGKTSCRNCAFSGKKDYQQNEIVRFVTAETVIPFGADVIISSKVTEENNPQFVVEYKGKLILVRASDLEPTGQSF